MAPGMMRQMIANIQNATFFTITADEAADVSNKKQLVIWIRWVDDCFVIYEDFIEMHPLNKCRSSSSNTKECPTENKFKHLERPGAVLSWRGDEDRRENWRNYANSNYQRKMLIHALLWTCLQSGCRWCHNISSMQQWFTWHSMRNWKAG